MDAADSAHNSASVTSPQAVVKIDRLSDVAGNSKYQVDKTYDEELMPKDPDQILHDAETMLGQTRKYNPFSGNCEHFATSLRYGNPESRQVCRLC